MLTDKQWGDLYTASIENRKDIIWIRKALDRDDFRIEDCRKDIKALEINQGFRKGKVAFLAVTITTVFTVLANVVLWSLSHFGAK
jgi:hypothetical protein